MKKNKVVIETNDSCLISLYIESINKFWYNGLKLIE